MAGLNEFRQGLSDFLQGVQQYSVGQGIRGAQEQIQQINAQQMDEMDKRQALTQVSQGLAMHLAGLGAPASTIAQTVEAIKPQAITSADQAILQGQMTGSKRLTDLGLQAQMQQAQPQFQLQREQQAFTGKENQLNRETELMKARIAASAKDGTLKALTTGEVDKLQGFEDRVKQGQLFLEQVKSNADLVGPGADINPLRGFSTEKSSFDADLGRWFDQYRKEITGAGAGPAEIKMLRENTPKRSDLPEVFQQKMQNLITLGAQQRQRYLTNLGKAKRDIRGFISAEDEGLMPGASAASGKPKLNIQAGERVATHLNTRTGNWEKVVVDQKGMPIRRYEE